MSPQRRFSGLKAVLGDLTEAFPPAII